MSTCSTTVVLFVTLFLVAFFHFAAANSHMTNENSHSLENLHNSNVTIYGYHFHIYFLPNDDYALHSAQQIYEAMKQKWGARAYRDGAIRLFDKPVGPHSWPMTQFELGADDAQTNFDLLREVLPWVQLNVDTNEHPVLVHPLTTPFSKEEEVNDHTVRALWLGQRLGLNLRKL